MASSQTTSLQVHTIPDKSSDWYVEDVHLACPTLSIHRLFDTEKSLP